MIKKVLRSAICIIIMLSLCCCALYGFSCFAVEEIPNACEAPTPLENEADESVISSIEPVVVHHFYGTQRISLERTLHSSQNLICDIFNEEPDFNPSEVMQNLLFAKLNRINQQVILKLNE